MNCCINCFRDAQIREMIRTNNRIGNCSFCGHTDVPIYSLDEHSDLSDLISEVVNVYEEFEEGEPLSEILLNDWNIFDKNDRSFDLIRAFCNIAFEDKNRDCNAKVRIPRQFAEKYGIFSGHSWDEFSTVIKTQNRFYNGFFRADQFASFLTYSISKYRKGSTFYRARICSDKKGYNIYEMGAPPPGRRKAGRVNPEGIGVLYLTSDRETTLNEVRASTFDFVSIGAFQLRRDINVVNIASLSNISPVLYSSGLESLAANIKVFSAIAKEIAKPLRRNDSPLEYLPTQYITEFIKSSGYAGVEYASTMGTGGSNIAVFDESLFKCLSVDNVEIKKIKYFYRDLITES